MEGLDYDCSGTLLIEAQLASGCKMCISRNKLSYSIISLSMLTFRAVCLLSDSGRRVTAVCNDIRYPSNNARKVA